MADSVSDVVAANVLASRLRAGITQTELAEKVTAAGYPMTQAVLSTIESRRQLGGQIRPRKVLVDELVAFAHVLNMSVDDLLDPRNATVPVKVIRPGRGRRG